MVKSERTNFQNFLNGTKDNLELIGSCIVLAVLTFGGLVLAALVPFVLTLFGIALNIVAWSIPVFVILSALKHFGII